MTFTMDGKEKPEDPVQAKFKQSEYKLDQIAIHELNLAQWGPLSSLVGSFSRQSNINYPKTYQMLHTNKNLALKKNFNYDFC